MNKPTFGPCFLMLLSVIAAAPIAAAQDPATTPKITSISKITTAKNQTITITGTGFGTHSAYTGNSKFISFDDQTKSWEAGYQPDGDTVTLIVNSWTATKIVLGGFAGKWGTSNFTLAAGNKEFIRLWNAQSAGGTFGLTCGSGCVSKTVTVVKASTSTEIRSSKKATVYGEPVTFRAVVTSGDGVPPDGELVSFMRGEEVLGTGKLKGGVARFTTSALEFGENSIRAVYAGDSDFERTSRDEESASLKHTVE
jgi:Bacterial Ig-like domain (group 3)/IPT/TIG domain